MGNRAKREYLDAICERYRDASKKQKRIILDEFCHVCTYNRKYAIRLLRQRITYLSKSRTEQQQLQAAQRRPGRPPRYTDPAIVEFLTVLWRAMNLACSKRIKAAIPYWLPSYDHPLKGRTLDLLRHISAATIDRLLRPLRSRYSKLGLATTKPGSLLKKHIPINTNQWDERQPGYLEADTVAHCGSSMAGMFVFTLNCTDIATGWTEHRATWGKGEQGVLRAIQSIEEALPFPLLGFDSDNGSEFLNWPLLKYFADRKRPVQYTRSREYYKNDNAHVEEKNWTHVRQYLGYQRFEDERMVALMNDLYCSEWRLLMNFFLPQTKLVAKERIGSKTVKKHDKAQTPLQRLLASPYISDEIKQHLRAQLWILNPFSLHRQVSLKIKQILRLATPPVAGQPSAMAKVKNKNYHDA
jgi:hypothetical protein